MLAENRSLSTVGRRVHRQSIRSRKIRSWSASLSSPTGLISWGKQKYKGELQLLTNPGQESCDLVNLVPMEAYLTTLLSKEMNGTWPVEALKAQAVAARTYAYDRIKKGMGVESQDKLYHIESSEKDQVSGNYSDITQKTLQAARETEGEILVDLPEKSLRRFSILNAVARHFVRIRFGVE